MTDPHPARQPWQRPTYRRLLGGDAQLGANPVIPDGPFSRGS